MIKRQLERLGEMGGPTAKPRYTNKPTTMQTLAPKSFEEHPSFPLPQRRATDLDREKHLAQSPGGDDVVHPLLCEPAALKYQFVFNLVVLGHLRKKKYHAKGIIQVPHGVHKGWIAVTNDVINFGLGLSRLQPLQNSRFIFGGSFLQLAQEHLYVPKFLDQGLVGQVLDVLYKIVRLELGRSFVHFTVILRLAWIDTFKNAQSPATNPCLEAVPPPTRWPDTVARHGGQTRWPDTVGGRK